MATTTTTTIDARRRLSTRRYKDHILKRVFDNRVMIIMGETGSGKSTQVPQVLVEEGLAPVLCTQSRRLAVVAKFVAEEMHCKLGTAVGYRIGQMNKSSESSNLVFQTAGVLLEDLKVRGSNALSKYKVVILDKVHERSVETDMVLCCLKLLLSKNKNLRVVLMSATADFKRYADYFSGLGPEVTVPTVASQACKGFL